jgi:arginine decarboxylase
MVVEKGWKEDMLAKEYCISKGVGVSKGGLPSFDKALLDAGVGNYNLVRLSSILPAKCRMIDVKELPERLPEGSLLPTAYSTITSDVVGETIVSSIGFGISSDPNKVGVIMEYSDKNITEEKAIDTLYGMIREAFDARGWDLKHVILNAVSAKVEEKDTKYTTFACISEW